MCVSLSLPLSLPPSLPLRAGKQAVCVSLSLPPSPRLPARLPCESSFIHDIVKMFAVGYNFYLLRLQYAEGEDERFNFLNGQHSARYADCFDVSGHSCKFNCLMKNDVTLQISPAVYPLLINNYI